MAAKCLSQEQLLSYVRDELKEEDRFQVQDHLLRCSLCNNAVEGIAELDKLEDAEIHLNNLSDDVKIKVNYRLSLKRFRYYVSAAAVLIAACTAVLILLNKNNSTELFGEYFKPYPNIVPMVRGDESNFDLKAAMVLYNSGNYKQAITEFDKILSLNSENETAMFYKGVSQLSLGQGENSAAGFHKVLSLKEGRLKDQSEWYLALSYLRENEIVKSVNVLTEIIAANNHYSRQALELKDKLTDDD